MTDRLISVGDDFTIPAAVKTTDANLPPASKAAAIALKLDANAAAATYVRFVDELGNPLAGRHVVVKVSATTGEIIDIVSEV